MFNRLKKMFDDSTRLSDAPKIVSYVEGIRDVKPRTEDTYTEAIRTVIRAVGYDPKLSEIDVVLLADYQQWLRDNYGAVTSNSRTRTLRAVLNKLHSRGLIDRSFSEQFRMRPEPPKAVKAVTEENKDLMLDSADLKWRAIINVLWFTGCRRGGLLGMRVKDFKVWHEGGAPVGTVKVLEKADRPRTVFMKAEAVESIELHLRIRPMQTSPFLFAGRDGQSLSQNIVTTMLSRISRRAHIPKDQPTNPHSFRHAFAIRNLDNGVSPEVVADWMGIDVMTMLRYYTTRDENRLRELYRQHAVG